MEEDLLSAFAADTSYTETKIVKEVEESEEDEESEEIDNDFQLPPGFVEVADSDTEEEERKGRYDKNDMQLPAEFLIVDDDESSEKVTVNDNEKRKRGRENSRDVAGRDRGNRNFELQHVQSSSGVIVAEKGKHSVKEHQDYSKERKGNDLKKVNAQRSSEIHGEKDKKWKVNEKHDDELNRKKSIERKEDLKLPSEFMVIDDDDVVVKKRDNRNEKYEVVQKRRGRITERHGDEQNRKGIRGERHDEEKRRSESVSGRYDEFQKKRGEKEGQDYTRRGSISERHHDHLRRNEKTSHSLEDKHRNKGHVERKHNTGQSSESLSMGDDHRKRNVNDKHDVGEQRNTKYEMQPSHEFVVDESQRRGRSEDKSSRDERQRPKSVEVQKRRETTEEHELQLPSEFMVLDDEWTEEVDKQDRKRQTKQYFEDDEMHLPADFSIIDDESRRTNRQLPGESRRKGSDEDLPPEFIVVDDDRDKIKSSGKPDISGSERKHTVFAAEGKRRGSLKSVDGNQRRHASNETTLQQSAASHFKVPVRTSRGNTHRRQMTRSEKNDMHGFSVPDHEKQKPGDEVHNDKGMNFDETKHQVRKRKMNDIVPTQLPVEFVVLESCDTDGRNGGDRPNSSTKSWVPTDFSIVSSSDNNEDGRSEKNSGLGDKETKMGKLNPVVKKGKGNDGNKEVRGKKRKHEENRQLSSDFARTQSNLKEEVEDSLSGVIEVLQADSTTGPDIEDYNLEMTEQLMLSNADVEHKRRGSLKSDDANHRRHMQQSAASHADFGIQDSLCNVIDELQEYSVPASAVGFTEGYWINDPPSASSKHQDFFPHDSLESIQESKLYTEVCNQDPGAIVRPSLREKMTQLTREGEVPSLVFVHKERKIEAAKRREEAARTGQLSFGAGQGKGPNFALPEHQTEPRMVKKGPIFGLAERHMEPRKIGSKGISQSAGKNAFIGADICFMEETTSQGNRNYYAEQYWQDINLWTTEIREIKAELKKVKTLFILDQGNNSQKSFNACQRLQSLSTRLEDLNNTFERKRMAEKPHNGTKLWVFSGDAKSQLGSQARTIAHSCNNVKTDLLDARKIFSDVYCGGGREEIIKRYNEFVGKKNAVKLPILVKLNKVFRIERQKRTLRNLQQRAASYARENTPGSFQNMQTGKEPSDTVNIRKPAFGNVRHPSSVSTANPQDEAMYWRRLSILQKQVLAGINDLIEARSMLFNNKGTSEVEADASVKMAELKTKIEHYNNCLNEEEERKMLNNFSDRMPYTLARIKSLGFTSENDMATSVDGVRGNLRRLRKMFKKVVNQCEPTLMKYQPEYFTSLGPQSPKNPRIDRSGDFGVNPLPAEGDGLLSPQVPNNPSIQMSRDFRANPLSAPGDGLLPTPASQPRTGIGLLPLPPQPTSIARPPSVPGRPPGLPPIQLLVMPPNMPPQEKFYWERLQIILHWVRKMKKQLLRYLSTMRGKQSSDWFQRRKNSIPWMRSLFIKMMKYRRELARRRKEASENGYSERFPCPWQPKSRCSCGLVLHSWRDVMHTLAKLEMKYKEFCQLLPPSFMDKVKKYTPGYQSKAVSIRSEPQQDHFKVTYNQGKMNRGNNRWRKNQFKMKRNPNTWNSANFGRTKPKPDQLEETYDEFYGSSSQAQQSFDRRRDPDVEMAEDLRILGEIDQEQYEGGIEDFPMRDDTTWKDLESEEANFYTEIGIVAPQKQMMHGKNDSFQISQTSPQNIGSGTFSDSARQSNRPGAITSFGNMSSDNRDKHDNHLSKTFPHPSQFHSGMFSNVKAETKGVHSFRNQKASSDDYIPPSKRFRLSPSGATSADSVLSVSRNRLQSRPPNPVDQSSFQQTLFLPAQSKTSPPANTPGILKVPWLFDKPISSTLPLQRFAGSDHQSTSVVSSSSQQFLSTANQSYHTPSKPPTSDNFISSPAQYYPPPVSLNPPLHSQVQALPSSSAQNYPPSLSFYAPRGHGHMLANSGSRQDAGTQGFDQNEQEPLVSHGQSSFGLYGK